MYQLYIYLGALLFSLCFINIYVFRKNTAEKELVKSLRRLDILVTITVVSSVTAMVCPNLTIALFFENIHYVTTEIMLILLILFLELYTEIKVSRAVKYIMYIYCAVCSVSLLLNSAFHHVSTVSREDIGKGEILNIFTFKTPGYDFHMYFSYIVAVIAAWILIMRLLKTVSLYRKKYFLCLIVLIATAALDVACKIIDFDHDFSLYGYTTLMGLYTFFVVFYKPKSIIDITLAYMVEDAHMGVMCFDPEDKCIFVNEEATLFFPDAKSNFDYEAAVKEIMGIESFKGSGERRWQYDFTVSGVELNCYLVFSKIFDEKDGYIGCYLSIYDRTDDVERYKHERYKSTHDKLTGIHNKDYFYEKVHDLIVKNKDKEYNIIRTNFKDFKLVNNMFGYKTGNDVLIKFAEGLKKALSENGCVCARLVSDNFAVCIPRELYEEEKLINYIKSAEDFIKYNDFNVRIQAGVYRVQPKDDDVSVMCDRASMALDTIKGDYDTVVAYYDDSLMDKVINRKFMINDFDDALSDNQFKMFLQPQVLTDGKVVGAEALVRWIQPQNGMVSPGDFIPAFEESGLIHRLDLCIWEQAAAKLKEWKDRGRDDLHISVNISTKDFYYLDLYKTFTELVKKYDIKPENLKLEITETALMVDLKKQLELIDRLQKYGFHVEIDDFGSGYSSLNMLKNLKADVLKLDMGFIREIKDRERTKAVLSMVVELAKRLKMLVISEGVEKKEQVDYLTEIGCDMFQGFYFARPVPIEEFESKYMLEKV